MSKKTITSTIDRDWIQSLLDTDENTSTQVIEILHRERDDLYDYIDEGIKELFAQWCRDNGDPTYGDEEAK